MANCSTPPQGEPSEYYQGYWAGCKAERQRVAVHLRSVGVDIQPIVDGDHWGDELLTVIKVTTQGG